MARVRLAHRTSRPRRPPVDLATLLAAQLTLARRTGWVREYAFHGKRKWRLDIAWPDFKLGVECEGMGARGGAGRHQLTQHVHANTEKHSALAVAGWRLIRVTGNQIRSGHALRWIDAAFGLGGPDVFDIPYQSSRGAGRRGR